MTMARVLPARPRESPVRQRPTGRGRRPYRRRPPTGTEPRPAEPAAAVLPVEPGPEQDDPAAGDLRTNEVVARIWIAPFVDANGVFREASHVRVVLEPAGWRLP